MTAAREATHQAAARRKLAATDPVLELALPQGQPFRACKGEVVGLAGLGGHGQTRMLLALFDCIQLFDNRRSCSLKLCTCLLKPVTRSLSAAFSRCIRPDIVRHSAKAFSHSSSLFE